MRSLQGAVVGTTLLVLAGCGETFKETHEPTPFTPTGTSWVSASATSCPSAEAMSDSLGMPVAPGTNNDDFIDTTDQYSNTCAYDGAHVAYLLDAGLLIEGGDDVRPMQVDLPEAYEVVSELASTQEDRALGPAPATFGEAAFEVLDRGKCSVVLAWSNGLAIMASARGDYDDEPPCAEAERFAEAFL